MSTYSEQYTFTVTNVGYVKIYIHIYNRQASDNHTMYLSHTEG